MENEKILEEWILRGYVTSDPEQRPKYLSYIEQAKIAILSYCNIPLNIKNFPQGLFYAWVDIAWGLSQGGEFNQSSGVLSVKSVKEGDTSVEFNSSSGGDSKIVTSYASVLNKYRRLI